MIIFYLIYAFIILMIFNFLIGKFCVKMQFDQSKQAKNFRVINMIMVTLLVCSYLRVLNVAV